MSEATKLKMVLDYWRHSDEGLRDEFMREDPDVKEYDLNHSYFPNSILDGRG